MRAGRWPGLLLVALGARCTAQTLPTEDDNGVCAKVESEQSNTWQQGHQVGWNFDIHIRFPLAEMEADEMLEKVIRIEWENDLTIQHLEPQGAVTFVGGGRRYVLVKPQPQYVGHDYFSVKGIRKGGAPEDLLEPTITCSGGEDVPPPSSARVGRDGLTAQTARRSRQSRSTSAAPLPSANCNDDATYAFEDGVRPDGARITWHCADWVGYLCAPGGFGVVSAEDIAALLEACPFSCADGRCHNASAPVRLLPLTGARFEEVRTGVECASDNVARGLYGGASATGGLQECANACAVQQGCSFFIYGVGSQAGKCWQETTADATCVEGWEEAEYNFYALLPPLPPAPPPPGVPSPVGSPLRTPLLPPSPSPPPPPWAGTSVRAPPGPPAGLPPWAAGVDRTSLPSDDGGGDLRITPAALVAVAVGPLLGAFAIGAVVFLAYRRMSPGRRRVRLEEHEIPNTSMELVPAGGPVVPSPLLGMSQG